MSSDQKKEIERLRQDLRKVDDELFELVCQRVDVIRKIGAVKKALNLPVLDAGQERVNKQRNLEVAAGRVPSELINQMTDLLAEWSRDIQSSQP